MCLIKRMNTFKTIVFCGLIVGIIIIIVESVLLKLLGLQYTTLDALITLPLSLIIDSLQRDVCLA